MTADMSAPAPPDHLAALAAERAAGWNAARDAAVAAADAEYREWMRAKDSAVALGCSFARQRIRDLPFPDADALARVVGGGAAGRDAGSSADDRAVGL